MNDNLRVQNLWLELNNQNSYSVICDDDNFVNTIWLKLGHKNMSRSIPAPTTKYPIAATKMRGLWSQKLQVFCPQT